MIVIPQEEPVITEIPDDDDDGGKHKEATEVTTDATETTEAEPSTSSDKNQEEAKTDEEMDSSINNESDVQILEPQISVMDLDDFEDLPEDSVGDANQTNPVQVKIKEEPKYEGYADENEDDAFEDVGTFEGVAVGLLDEGTSK